MYYKATADEANQKSRYDILQRVISEYRQRHFVPTPPSDALVIHLRLGDVVSKAPVPVDYLLVCSGPAAHYHTQIKSLYELLRDAKKVGKSRLILVGGSHLSMGPQDPSWLYAVAIRRAFEIAGYDVSLHLDPTPDEDFIYLSLAKSLITGAGGYSRYAAKLVEQNGGKVFGRRF